MNVRYKLRELKKIPLTELLYLLAENGKYSVIFEDELSLWLESYDFYYLTLTRLLPEMSLARRYRECRHCIQKYGEDYSVYQQRIIKKYHEHKHYLLLDFVNFAIHTRMLLDRTISLSKFFIEGQNIPSFSSFNNHRKFFLRDENTPYFLHEEYAEFIREETDWFENLKLIRDKYIVHTQSLHSKWLGFRLPTEKNEVELTIELPRGQKDKPLSKVEWVKIDVIEIIGNIEVFLSFFNQYAVKTIEKNKN